MNLTTEKEPLFVQFKRTVLEELKKLKLKSGDKIPSENEFCRKSEVSIRTVRRTLLELEKDGVLVRHQGRGTFLRSLDAAQKDLSNKVVGVLFSGMNLLTRPATAEYLKGVEDSCNELNLRCRMYPVGRRFGKKMEDLEPLDKIIPLDEINGLVILSPIKKDDIVLLRKRDTAFVAVHKYKGFNVKVAATDFKDVADLALTHLIDMGHRKISLISGYANPGGEAARLVNDDLVERASELATESGVEVDINFSDHSETSGYQIAIDSLSSAEPPTAFFTIDESLTRGAANAIFDKGLRIPQDVALLGCGNPRFSSVNTPSLENGRNAVALLNEIISGRQPHKNIIMTKPELHVRQSTDYKREL
jgi:LacI family transcriptional regulator